MIRRLTQILGIEAKKIGVNPQNLQLKQKFWLYEVYGCNRSVGLHQRIKKQTDFLEVAFNPLLSKIR